MSYNHFSFPDLKHLKEICRLRKVRGGENEALSVVLWNMSRCVNLKLPKSKIRFWIKFDRFVHWSEFHLRATDESVLSVAQSMVVSPNLSNLSQLIGNKRTFFDGILWSNVFNLAAAQNSNSQAECLKLVHLKTLIGSFVV